MNHTPEPWHLIERGDLGNGDEADLSVESGGNMRGYLSLADARRVVACVNACAGIDTDFLERTHDKGHASGIAAHMRLDREHERIKTENETLRNSVDRLCTALTTQAEEAAKLMEQRDELLEALRKISRAGRNAVGFRDLQMVAADAIAKYQQATNERE